MKAKEEQSKLKKPIWPLYALAFTFVLNLVFYGLMRHNADEEFQQIGQVITKEASQSFKIWIEEQRKIASLFVLSTPMQDWLEVPASNSLKATVDPKLIRYVRNVVSRFNQFENISVEKFENSKQPWDTLESGLYELKGSRISAHEFKLDQLTSSGSFEAILQGKAYFISSIFKSEETGKPIFYYSIPIMKNNEIIGITTLTVRMSYFTDALIQDVTYRQTGYLLFVDDRGETIAHTMESYILSNEKYLKDIVNELLTSLKIKDNYFRGNFQGNWKQYYGVSSDLDSQFIRNQWYIVFTEKESAIYSQANRFLVLIMASSLSVLFLLFFYIYRLELGKAKRRQVSRELIEKERLEAELIQKNSEIIKRINMDQLTGIGHFQTILRYLEQQINELKDTDEVLTFVLFRVDYLRKFNEEEGYVSGDIILNYVGKLLRELFEAPYVSGRLYGNVFAVLFKGQMLIESLILVEQFRTHYEEQNFALIPQKPSLSFAVVQWEGETAGEMVRKAETLLQKCKKEGSRQIKY